MRCLRKNLNRRLYDMDMKRFVRQQEVIDFIKTDAVMITSEIDGSDLTNEIMKTLIQELKIPDLDLIQIIKKYPKMG